MIGSRWYRPTIAVTGALEHADGNPPDAPARYNRRYTAAVLAAYRVLRDVGSDHGLPSGEELRQWLTEAFVEPWRERVAGYTRTALDAAPDPFAAMVAYTKAREHSDFGAEFVFEHPVDDDERFHADVHRCGYHDFFLRHGSGELTPIFCAFDANWIGAIEPERDGFAFDRRTTIGLGGTHCPFHFERRRPDDRASGTEPQTR